MLQKHTIGQLQGNVQIFHDSAAGIIRVLGVRRGFLWVHKAYGVVLF